jgi:hypothetical protein
MVKPRSAFPALARQSASGGIWLAAKRPLFLALLLGCTISLAASTVLNLRLAASAIVCWSFVPLAEIAGLLAVCRRDRARSIDLFFTGQGPWALWLIGLGAIWSSLPPPQAFAPTRAISLLVPILWSAWIDLYFFRFVLGRGRGSAFRGLLLQRLISWTLVMLIFGATSIPPEIVARIGL